MTTAATPVRLELDDATLARDGVELWRVDLDAGREPPEAVVDDLDETERARLQRYLKVGDRARFAGLRSALRRRLGILLDMSPRDVPIRIDERGRPYLSDETLRFNLAHSGEHGLFAVSPHVTVGVDIERARDHERLEQMVRMVFSAPEQRLWEAENTKGREELFLKVWTAKEAVLKAIGLGLSADPRSFSVLGADRYLSFAGDLPEHPAGSAEIVLCGVLVPAGYTAALCALIDPDAPSPVHTRPFDR